MHTETDPGPCNQGCRGGCTPCSHPSSHLLPSLSSPTCHCCCPRGKGISRATSAQFRPGSAEARLSLEQQQQWAGSPSPCSFLGWWGAPRGTRERGETHLPLLLSWAEPMQRSWSGQEPLWSSPQQHVSGDRGGQRGEGVGRKHVSECRGEEREPAWGL